MPRLFRCLFFSAIWLLLIGCGDDPDSPTSVEVATTPVVTTLLSVNSENSGHLQIKKDALKIGSEFLLHVATRNQKAKARGYSLKSRIVAFKNYNNKIYMLQAAQGIAMETGVPFNVVLAEFEIVSENESLYVVDFNGGTSRLFKANDWYSHDSSGRSPENNLSHWEVTMSFVRESKVNSKNQLTLTQIVQLSGYGAPYEVKYYLSPYAPNPNFEPLLAPDMEQVGFVSTAPYYNDKGESLVYAAKWDLSKPVVFAISANTPKAYRQAVKDGVLYWNTVLENAGEVKIGEGPFRVVDAPEGVYAPDSEYNVIQWMNWPDTRIAWADPQTDPRTGEIKHAQAYLSSGWVVESKASARRFVRQADSGRKAKGIGIGLQNFEVGATCAFQPDVQFSKDLRELLANGETSTEDFVRVSQDFMRFVTAHEIGHVLGLRHNFAGSTWTSGYQVTQRYQYLKNYLSKTPEPEPIKSTSSVMDYPDYLEATLSGALIGNKKESLPYDERVLQVLYFGKSFKDSQIPPFCTDTQKRNYADCDTYDFGKSPVAVAYGKLDAAYRDVARSVVHNYVVVKRPIPGEHPVSVERVSLDGSSLGNLAARGRDDLVGYLWYVPEVVSIRRDYPHTSKPYQSEIKLFEFTYVKDEMLRLGGLAKLLRPIPLDYASALEREVEELMAKESDEVFSDSDRAHIKSEMARVSDEVQQRLVEKDLDALTISTANAIEDAEVASWLLPMFLERIELYAFSLKEGETLEFTADVTQTDGSKKNQSFKVTPFRYKKGLRRQAVKLLDPDTIEIDDWADVERKDYEARFETLLESFLGGGIQLSKIDLASVSNEQAKSWISENIEVLKAFKP